MNWIYVAIAAALLTVGFGGGYELEHRLSETTLANLKAQHAAELAAAYQAKDNADLRAAAAERTAATTQAQLVSDYERKINDERTASDTAISNLRAGLSSLRVTLAATTRGSNLPNPAPSPAGSDGQASATIAGSVAARLAGRYADYNEIVAQLTLCQGVVESDRAAQKVGNTTPVN